MRRNLFDLAVIALPMLRPLRLLWWAFTTMTKVGYGDRYPVTTTGRVAAVGLMLGGIAVLGIFTATFASWLVERVSAETDATTNLADEVSALRDEIAELKLPCRGRSRSP